MKHKDFVAKAEKKHRGLNRELLRKIAARLRGLRHEKHYRQAVYATKTVCGTACCIAGWACLIEGVKANELVEAENEYRFGSPTHEWAQNLLGLTDRQAKVLFSPDAEWPAKFGQRFYDALVKKGRPSRIAAEFLDALADGKVKL